jgi:hypothetical protein
MVAKAEAQAQVEELINEIDWDWPNRPRQVVYEDLTVETGWGWVFYHASDPEHLVHGRDRAPQDNPPYLVNKDTGECKQAEAGQDLSTLTW